MEPTGKYACSLHDEDNYSGEYDTIEEAFGDAIDNANIENEDLDEEEQIEIVYAGEIMKFMPRIDAARIIEDIQEQAYNEVNEYACDYACDYLENISNGDIKKLGQMLTETFNKWAKETNNEPKFFTIEGIEEREIKLSGRR